MYYFFKEDPDDKIWRVEELDDDGYPLLSGLPLVSFDKKKVFNILEDYPWNFSAEEKEIFDKENPYWVEFFKGKRN